MQGIGKGAGPRAENRTFLFLKAQEIPYTGGVQLWRVYRSKRRHRDHIMTIWQNTDQRPETKLRHWHRKSRILARKAAHKGHIRSILTWRIWSALLILLMVVISLLANPAYRHWVLTALSNIAIIGGILAAPVISLVAWIGVTLPTHAPLHQAAPTLFIGALLWMAMGIVSAHARREGHAQG